MSKRHKKSPWPVAGLVFSFLGSVSAGAVGLFALRENNKDMLQLRDAVFEADEAGLGIQESIDALQNHVSSHMNANPPKLGDNSAIQLKSSYDRARQAETERMSAARTELAQQATSYCEANVRNVQLSVRAQCVAQYIADRPITEKQIVADLYRYNFISPRWSPDLAGWSLVVACALGAIFVMQLLARFLAVFVIKD